MLVTRVIMVHMGPQHTQCGRKPVRLAPAIVPLAPAAGRIALVPRADCHGQYVQHALHLAFELHGVQWASSLAYQVLNYMTTCRVLPQRVTFISCEGHKKYVLQDLHAELGIGTYFCHSLVMAPVLGSKAGTCCGCGSIRVAIGPERGVPSTDKPSIVVSRTPKS